MRIDEDCWSTIGKIKLYKGRIQAELGLGCRQVKLVSCCKRIKVANGSRGTATVGTSCNLYPHLCLETVFPAYKLMQNCYTYIMLLTNYNLLLKTVNLGSIDKKILSRLVDFGH